MTPTRAACFFVRCVLAALFVVVPSTLARAQGEADAELFVRAQGADVRAAIRIQIHDGWHLYHDVLGPADAVGKPTVVELTGEGVTWSPVRFPKPVRLEQPGVGEGGRDTWIQGHVGTIVLYARGVAAQAAKLDSIRAKLNGLTCQDNGSCVLYRAELDVAGQGPDELFAAFPADLGSANASADASAAPPTPAKPAAQTKKSFGRFGPGGRGVLPSSDFPPGVFALSKLYARSAADDLRVAIEVRVAPSYHMYHDVLGPPDAVGKPTTIEFDGVDADWSKPRFPEPTRLPQPGVGAGGRDTWINGHEGTFVIYAHAKTRGAVELGTLSAKIHGLTCTDAGECVPYDATLENSGLGDDALFARFPTDLAVESSPAATRATDAHADSAEASDIDWDKVVYRAYQPIAGNDINGPGEQESPRSLLVWLFFAFIAGILLNVMPCVLPVVSIKVLSFVQQAGESRSRVLALGLAFSAGILVVFEALASLAAFAGKGWGEQFKDETFKITMIAIVFGFALSLFDVYELGVPSKVGELAAVKREGLGDAFFKGIMATLLATPCSGPFLGSTLAWALAQPVLVIFAVFTSVGLGMAAPYALLTSNPALLKYVPRPGAWMKTFKHLMGFLLLGTVIFLMISVESKLLLFTVALLVFVALGCWWWGNFATFDKTRLQKTLHFAVAASIVALGARFAFVDLRGWLTPDEFWKPFDPVALERAHARNQNVFVDFTANWCLTCKTNATVVYTADATKAALKRKGFLVLEADETSNSPRTAAIQRLRQQLGARSIPFMAIFPGNDPLHPRTLKDLVTPSEFLALVEACPDP